MPHTIPSAVAISGIHRLNFSFSPTACLMMLITQYTTAAIAGTLIRFKYCSIYLSLLISWNFVRANTRRVHPLLLRRLSSPLSSRRWFSRLEWLPHPHTSISQQPLYFLVSACSLWLLLCLALHLSFAFS